MNRTQDIAALVARILLALIFIMFGFDKLTNLAGTAGYIASKGLPLPMVAAAGAGLLEVVGGLMLVIGFKARWAALALAGFTLLSGIIFHDFWNADAAAKMGQSINFWKNVSMAGGLLLAFAFGPGRIAVDKEA
jgi:putative oxidoreductase